MPSRPQARLAGRGNISGDYYSLVPAELNPKARTCGDDTLLARGPSRKKRPAILRFFIRAVDFGGVEEITAKLPGKRCQN